MRFTLHYLVNCDFLCLHSFELLRSASRKRLSGRRQALKTAFTGDLRLFSLAFIQILAISRLIRLSVPQTCSQLSILQIGVIEFLPKSKASSEIRNLHKRLLREFEQHAVQTDTSKCRLLSACRPPDSLVRDADRNNSNECKHEKAQITVK